MLIGDICNNHCGSRAILEAMVKALSGAGVDIAKVQSYRADKLRKDYPDYEKEYSYYKTHELSEDDHRFFIEICEKYKIQPLTTVFDMETVDFLAGELGLKQVKIASPDANNWALIDRCLEKFEKVIISAGLHTQQEIRSLQSYVGGKNVAILHCVSKYPTDMQSVNMRQLMDGFSDHTTGLDAAKLAISLGAEYVERHFTLSRHLPGKDHHISSTPEEFAELVTWRDNVKTMMGSGVRELSAEELANREKYRGRWSA